MTTPTPCTAHTLPQTRGTSGARTGMEPVGTARRPPEVWKVERAASSGHTHTPHSRDLRDREIASRAGPWHSVQRPAAAPPSPPLSAVLRPVLFVLRPAGSRRAARPCARKRDKVNGAVPHRRVGGIRDKHDDGGELCPNCARQLGVDPFWLQQRRVGGAAQRVAVLRGALGKDAVARLHAARPAVVAGR